MAEQVKPWPWRLGSRIFLAAGDPSFEAIEGTSGIRDRFTGDFIDENGVLRLAYLIKIPGNTQLPGIAVDLPMGFVRTKGVHGFYLSKPETYGLALADRVKGLMVANAEVLAGDGESARPILLEVVEGY